jgi:tRNA threonylcarbamoyladenosine biosynthesis protein TsaE
LGNRSIHNDFINSPNVGFATQICDFIKAGVGDESMKKIEKKYRTHSSEETKELGRKFAAHLHGGEVVCMYGDLGAGKTTFISGVMDYFIPDRRVLSPTFVIVRHYEINNPHMKEIVHADLYRMNDAKEISSLGLTDFYYAHDGAVFIEWAERFGGVLPKSRTDITFTVADEDEREIVIKEYE